MSSTAILIVLIAKEYTLYASFAILIFGVISNILNIAVFTQLTIFRCNQSTFYFIIGSIFDCIQILLIFTIRIPTYSFNPDPTNTSIVLCKLRATISQICIVISLGIVCCAAIDQFLSTNYHARLRQMSTLKLAHCLTLIIACFALLHSVLFLVYYEIVPNLGCTPGNPIFRVYTTFIYYCILCGLLPVTIASTFAVLAYFNVRRLIQHQVPVFRRRLDKQLTVMVLARVFLYVITNLPYIISEIFRTNMPPNPSDILRIATIQLVSSVTYSIFFVNYSVMNI
jgi:hypothetical protein